MNAGSIELMRKVCSRHFLEFGDAEAYHEELETLRKQLGVIDRQLDARRRP